ncbi:MAG: hypothetical protein HY052_03130 [Proteobacteria bacterium]|nr:hypothetical protein [Pseudomonadota bacterium]
MRKIMMAAFALVLLVGAVLFLNLGGIVKTTIETAGSQVLGTAVRVHGLDISLSDKQAAMSGLSIANPDGFKSKALLTTKNISVALGDVRRNLVIIKDITVDGMTVTYELGPRGSNFDVIRKNLKAATVTMPASPSKAASGTDRAKVVIQKLRIVNARIIPAVSGLKTSVTLPEMIVTNIGSPGNPATPRQVAAEVMDKVLATSSAVMAASGPGTPADTLKSKIRDKFKALFK